MRGRFLKPVVVKNIVVGFGKQVAFCFASVVRVFKIFPFVQKYQVRYNHFRLKQFRSVFFIYGSGFQASFYVHQLSAYQKFFRPFGKRSPSGAVGVFHFALCGSGEVLVHAVGGYGEHGDFFAVGDSFYKRVFGDVSDKDDLVYGTHSMRGNQLLLIEPTKEESPNVLFDIEGFRNLKESLALRLKVDEDIKPVCGSAYLVGELAYSPDIFSGDGSACRDYLSAYLREECLAWLLSHDGVEDDHKFIFSHYPLD